MSGSNSGVQMTMVEALNDALKHEMAREPKLVLLGEDIGAGGGLFNVTKGLFEKYPDRVIDTPISENGFAGVGVGMAMAGHPVMVEFQVADFLLLALDQIYNAANMHFVSAGQVNVPIVFRGPCGFGTGFGVTHSQRLESLVAGRPGLKVVLPSNPADARGLLISALRDPNPVIFIEESTLYFVKGPVATDDAPIAIGSAKVLSTGTACTLISAGRALEVCRRACANDQVPGGVELIDLRTLRPMDWAVIEKSIKKTGRAAVALDGPAFGSLAASLVGELSQRFWADLRAKPRAITGIDVPAGTSKSIEVLAGVEEESVTSAIRSLTSEVIRS